MAEAAILEQKARIVVSDDLNSKATQEIESLLECSGKRDEEKKASPANWYVRMPMAGVRYYSF